MPRIDLARTNHSSIVPANKTESFENEAQNMKRNSKKTF